MPILGANSSGGSRPSAPVIGTATDGGTGTTASVAFTPSTYIGKGTINYTVTSSPGNITASGSSSPITVTGLTTGTAYTFTVQGTTNYGVTSAVSSASNSMTPVNPVTYDMDLLATSTATGTNTISFTGLSSAYNTFIVRGYYTAAVEGLSFVGGRFNGLTANYKYNNNVVTWTGSANAISAWGNTNSASSIVLQQALSGTSTPCFMEWIITGAQTTGRKSMTGRTAAWRRAYNGANSDYVGMGTGTNTANTAPITSIQFLFDYNVTATNIKLYGVK